MTACVSLRRWALLAALAPLSGCTKEPAKAPRIQTNEQGCTRPYNDGPQDPFKDPPPLKDTCLGPYLLRIPANYFDHQMGPEFDGSFGLYLEYPGLNPFAPGERSHLSLDVSTRTVMIGYSYLDRVGIHEWLQVQYTPSPWDHDDPDERFEGRIQGEEIHGLTPYYADPPRYFDHYRAKGYSDGDSPLDPTHYQDWYISRDANGQVQTVIKCDSRLITESGVEYRDGKLVRSKGEKLPDCDHVFIIPELKTAVDINYVRFALPDWKKIEDRARGAVHDFMVATPRSHK